MGAKKFPLNNFNNEKDITEIRKSLSQIKGVNAVRVDTVSNTITVDYDESRVSLQDLESRIQSLGGNIR